MGLSDDPPPVETTEAQELYIQKQCENCHKFYTDIENNYNGTQVPICFYNSGTIKSTYGTGTHLNSLINQDKRQVQALKHVEDQGYSAITARFPVNKESIDLIRQTYAENRAASASSNKSVDSTPEEIKHEEEYIIHQVASNDTLVGISLYYHAKIADIQKLNNLTSHQIFHKKTLLIPPPDVELPPKKLVYESNEQLRQQKLMKIFMELNNCSKEEAKYYMELCEFNIEEATKQWKMDDQWADAAKQKNNKPARYQGEKIRTRCC